MSKSMLLDGEEALIHIPIYFKEKKNKHGHRSFVILNEADGKKSLVEENSGVDVLNTKWKPQTWQMNNHLFKNSTSYNQATGSQDIDFTKYRNNIINECMIEWDMVDGKGAIIPVNAQSIGLLPANIVNELIKQYDSMMQVDEEEQGKS